jgi:3-hydroxybutyryl-CoA dehydrogenase
VSDVEKVGVIGGGPTGPVITEILSRIGVDVVVIQISTDAAVAAAHRVARVLRQAELCGSITPSDVTEVLDRLSFETDLEVLADRDLVIEAADEDGQTTLDLFRRVGGILKREDVILTSDTTSVPVARLGAVSGRAPHVIGMRAVSRGSATTLVELVPSLSTARHTIDRVRTWVTDVLGKECVVLPDRAGFVADDFLGKQSVRAFHR